MRAAKNEVARHHDERTRDDRRRGASDAARRAEFPREAAQHGRAPHLGRDCAASGSRRGGGEGASRATRRDRRARRRERRRSRSSSSRSRARRRAQATRARHGRARHGQRARRARDPRDVAARERSAREAELRGAPERAHRERALRPRGRRVHRRDEAAPRKIRARERRHACSSTRSATCRSPMQAKLLRVLQEREIERVGGSETIKVDARVVAATNRDLIGASDEGEFRRRPLRSPERRSALTFPPLRARREDIPILARHFLELAAKANDRRGMRIDDDGDRGPCRLQLSRKRARAPQPDRAARHPHARRRDLRGRRAHVSARRVEREDDGALSRGRSVPRARRRSGAQRSCKRR